MEFSTKLNNNKKSRGSYCVYISYSNQKAGKHYKHGNMRAYLS